MNKPAANSKRPEKKAPAKKPAAPDPADLNSLGNDLPALDLDEETLF